MERLRLDDCRVLSGIIFINSNGFKPRDAPLTFRLPKTLYNRWKRWSELADFARIFEGLATEAAPEPETIMFDASYLKAHRTASSLRAKKGRCCAISQPRICFSESAAMMPTGLNKVCKTKACGSAS